MVIQFTAAVLRANEGQSLLDRGQATHAVTRKQENKPSRILNKVTV